jgi:hypothetical protein
VTLAKRYALREQIANFFQQQLGSRRRRRRYRRRRFLQSVDTLDRKKQYQRNDEKIEHRLQERAVSDQYLLAAGILAESDRQVGKVHSADEFAQWRHDKVTHQR